MGLQWSFTMNASRSIALACAALACQPVLADTHNVSPAGFDISVRRELAASRATVYQSIGEIGQWWNGAHSFSGNARNLSLNLAATGCFCERWGTSSVEHGRVIHAAQDRLVRLQAALGPLQSMPVSAVLSFELTESAGGTLLLATYRVAGAGQDLAALAQPVNGVITEQVDRLARFITTGKPELK
jgi:hypothetical protein